MGLQPPKFPKFVLFGINCPKGVYLLTKFFTKFGLRKGVRGRTLMPNFLIVALKCGLTNCKKNGIFWYKFAATGKYRGSTEKFVYRCTTTNLLLCTDTIIVLKITLLYSVSVITNFVIPKRDKRTKNITLFRLQPARDPRSPPCWAWW